MICKSFSCDFLHPCMSSGVVFFRFTSSSYTLSLSLKMHREFCCMPPMTCKSFTSDFLHACMGSIADFDLGLYLRSPSVLEKEIQPHVRHNLHGRFSVSLWDDCHRKMAYQEIFLYIIEKISGNGAPFSFVFFRKMLDSWHALCVHLYNSFTIWYYLELSCKFWSFSNTLKKISLFLCSIVVCFSSWMRESYGYTKNCLYFIVLFNVMDFYLILCASLSPCMLTYYELAITQHTIQPKKKKKWYVLIHRVIYSFSYSFVCGCKLYTCMNRALHSILIYKNLTYLNSYLCFN